MGKGPALALLLTGPGPSLPNWMAIGRVFGAKKAVVYVSAIIVLGRVCGWFAGTFILSWVGIPVDSAGCVARRSRTNDQDRSIWAWVLSMLRDRGGHPPSRGGPRGGGHAGTYPGSEREMAKNRMFFTPAVRIADEIKRSGRVATVEEVSKWLIESAAGKKDTT